MIRHPKFLLSGFIIAALLTAALSAGDLPEFKYEKFELSNGLDVILHEDHSIPLVCVNIWYHVGSHNERIGRTGFAHLFEHLMFEGSEHHNVLYHDAIETIGGENNGGTNVDVTMYFANVPGNYLENLLWLEADRMGYLLPAIDQERLDLQRSIVINEKYERYDNQPYGKVQEFLPTMLFPPEHPYSWTVIGSIEDLKAASLEDVQEFFKLYYAPNNASLCIAGDFDPDQAKAWVKKYFEPIPPGKPVTRLDKWSPDINGVRRMTVSDNVSLPRLYMAWHTPAVFAPGDAEFDLLAGMLTQGKSSRLYKALVYDLQIAQSVACYQESRELGSIFNIIATAKPGHNLDEIEQAIDSVLTDVFANGLTAEEFNRSRVNWEAGFVRSLQELGGFGGRASQLNAYNTRLGDPGKLNWDKNRYTSATLDGVLEYARTYLDLNKRAIIHVNPYGDLVAAAETVDMADDPDPGAEPTFTPPKIQRAELDNGMEILLVEDHRLPLVQLNLIFRGGWGADPVDRLGTASLTAGLLNEGTTARSALEISDDARALGAVLNSGSDFDNCGVYLNVLSKNLDPALDLMAEVILHPTFPQEELDRLKKQYLGQIQQESRQPVTLAYNRLRRELYGADHPYGQPYTGSGTTETVNAISREDITRYYKTNYMPNNAAVVIVGDLSINEAKAKLNAAFKKWQPGKAVSHDIPRVNPPTSTKVFIVDKPGASQSAIFMGNLVIPRQAPEYVDLKLATDILGGRGTARLYMNLRQDKGYTYGAYSFLSGHRGQSAFISYAQVQTDFTKESLVEFIREIKGITGERPIPPDELKAGQNYLAKGFPQAFQTYTGVAEQMATLVTYDLSLDEWQAYMDHITSTDAMTVTKAAKRFIHPESLIIVVVGDREKIEAGIRELNLGEVEIVSSENI